MLSTSLVGTSVISPATAELVWFAWENWTHDSDGYAALNGSTEYGKESVVAAIDPDSSQALLDLAGYQIVLSSILKQARGKMNCQIVGQLTLVGHTDKLRVGIQE